MLALHKTKHSDMFRNVLQTGKGLNVLPNKAFILNSLFSQCYDEEIATEARTLWVELQGKLKTLHLDMDYLAVGYDTPQNQYHIVYEISSKIHSNKPLRIDRTFENAIPFVFVPQIFCQWLRDLIKEAPIDIFLDIARGN